MGKELVYVVGDFFSFVLPDIVKEYSYIETAAVFIFAPYYYAFTFYIAASVCVFRCERQA